MKNITNDMISSGIKKFINTYAQIEKMGESDGHKETCLKLIREVYPNYDFHTMSTTLIVLQRKGMIEGLNIENGCVVEPIKPRLTDKARKEIETRKVAFESGEMG